jgi:hypothetical protein
MLTSWITDFYNNELMSEAQEDLACMEGTASVEREGASHSVKKVDYLMRDPVFMTRGGRNGNRETKTTKMWAEFLLRIFFRPFLSFVR